MFGRHTPPIRSSDALDGSGDAEIIRAEGVVKTYSTGATEVQSLREIDFRVRRGEIVAVMGPSGCGKTTLLNCLSGLDIDHDRRPRPCADE